MNKGVLQTKEFALSIFDIDFSSAQRLQLPNNILFEAVNMLQEQKLMLVELADRRKGFKEYIIKSIGREPLPQTMESYKFVVE
jgi:hypothetical protein